MNLDAFTIQDTKQALDRKEFSAEELVLACLDRVKKYNGSLHVYLSIDKERVLQDAKRADVLRSQGVKKSLLGIPIALKDLYTSENIRTTAGSKILDNYIPPFDATVVTAYKEAGAVIIGKTNQDAWGHGSSGENSDYPPTRNPYDITRVPGGSSSGSAVAVRTGMCLAASGTDTGSSIRLPASYCNLVGIKPTYGRVSRYGIIAMASSFDTIGHMTKTVYDNAYIYEITAGKDSRDATSVDRPVPRYTARLGENVDGLKIGIPKEYFDIEGMDSKVQQKIEEAIRELEKFGIKVQSVSLPHTKYAMAAYYILVPSEISSNLSRFDGIRFGHDRSTFGQEAKRRIMIGTYALSSGYYDAYYKTAAKVRTLVKQDFEKAFDEVDIIAAPNSPTLPFLLGEKAHDPLTMYLSDIFLCPINIAGVPALSVPCGFADGLPVGLQLIGPQFEEERLYKLAYLYEQETKWYQQGPGLSPVPG